MAASWRRSSRASATPAQIGAILLGLRQKGECVAELVGAARASCAPSARCCRDAPAGRRRHVRHRRRRVAYVQRLDGCGARGRGGRRAGREARQSRGVRQRRERRRAGGARRPDRASRGDAGECLREVGIAFLFAPAFQPGAAARGAAASRARCPDACSTCWARWSTRPGSAGRWSAWATVGSSSRSRGALQALGVDRAWVVHGAGGLDELGLDGPSDVVEVTARERRRFQVDRAARWV